MALKIKYMHLKRKLDIVADKQYYLSQIEGNCKK